MSAKPNPFSSDATDAQPAAAGDGGLKPVYLWVALVCVLTLFGGWSVHLVRQLQRDRPPTAVLAPIKPPKSRDYVLAAGSGSNLPLTRALAAMCQANDAQLRISIDESIGSTGGVRALRDGAIDIGLVSRALRPAEQESAFVVIPYARVPVWLAVHPSVAQISVSSQQLVDLYSGQKSVWDNGDPAIVLQRERGDSAQEAVAAHLPSFGGANDLAWKSQRFRVLYHDRAMQDALVGTPGAIGLFDASAALTQHLQLKSLQFNGISPTLDNVVSGNWPFFKDLAFVVPRSTSAAVKRFLRCVSEPQGSNIISQSGAIVLPFAATEGAR